ncbi:MAG: hypothetical protein Q9181_004029 [Wetmoreana brouardii]
MSFQGDDQGAETMREGQVNEYQAKKRERSVESSKEAWLEQEDSRGSKKMRKHEESLPKDTTVRPTLETLPAEMLGCIAEALYQVGSPADLYNLLIALPPQPIVGSSSAEIIGQAVKPWLYRHLDVDFAGAESRGNRRLLATLFNDAFENGKYVRQVTFTIGPLAFDRGPRVLSRYINYVRKLIKRLPNLATFSTLVETLQIHQSIQKLHMTILLVDKKDVQNLMKFFRMGLKTLSFTFCYPYSPILQEFDLDKGRLSDLVRDVGSDETEDEVKQALTDTQSPVIEEVYFDGFDGYLDFNPEYNRSRLIFQHLLQKVDLSSLSFLEFRRCQYSDELLQLLSQKSELCRLKTLRVVGIPWCVDGDDLHGTTYHTPGYEPFFIKCAGLEEIVLDDCSFSAPFIRGSLSNSGDTLKKLELHTIKYDSDWSENEDEYPTEIDVKADDGFDAEAFTELGRHCPNVKELHIDVLRQEMEDNRAAPQNIRNQSTINALSISFPMQDPITFEMVEEMSRKIQSESLAKLNILYQPLPDPHLAPWDRFGCDEPWPLRATEEYHLMQNRDLKCRLRWTVTYQGGTSLIADAWSSTDTPNEKRLKRAVKALKLPYRAPSSPTGDKDLESRLQWSKKIYERAEQLTVRL